MLDRTRIAIDILAIKKSGVSEWLPYNYEQLTSGIAVTGCIATIRNCRPYFTHRETKTVIVERSEYAVFT